MNWIEKFWELYISDDADTIKQAFDLKKKNTPKFLYRYRNVSSYESLERVLNEIYSGKIYLSNPKNFNDPFDCSTVLNSIKSTDYFSKDELKESFKKLHIPDDIIDEMCKNDEWLKIFAQCFSSDKHPITCEQLNDFFLNGQCVFNNELTKMFRDAVRITCFSQKNNNMPMWYHYTDGFSGVCIEYTTENISNNLSNMLFPVQYNEILIDVIKDYLCKSSQKDSSLYDLVATRKLNDWSYENEWRFVVPTAILGAKENEVYEKLDGELHYFSKPTKVIMGYNIPKIAEKMIIDLCKKEKIKCTKAEITAFGLDIKE